MFKAAWRLFRKHPKRNTAILLLVFGGSAFAGVEYTATPRFCGTTCHIMDTYYVSWQNSKHRTTACVDCHIPPGLNSYVEAKLNGLGQVVDDVLNRTTMKPSASVSDFACLRSGCHVAEKLPKLDQTEKRPFKFDHAKHLAFEYKGIELKCTTCHSHVKGENHFEVNTNICINCHLLQNAAPAAPSKVAGETGGEAPVASPLAAVVATSIASAGDGQAAAPAVPAAQPANQPTSQPTTPPANQPAHAPPSAATGAPPVKPVAAPTACSNCHEPPATPFKYQGLTIDHAEYLRFGAQCVSCHKNATQQPKPISNGQCYECHDFGRERFTTVDEMHRVHSQGRHKVECFTCHGVIQHGPEAQIAVMKEFDCMKCHTGQHMVQRGAYGLAAPPAGHPAVGDGEEGDDTVSPMFLVHVDCTGCHIKPSPLSSKPTSGATVNKAVPEACDACHQPGFGKQLVGNWQKSTHSVFDAVTALLPSDAKPWANGNAEATKLVAEAKRVLEIVRVDGSWGVHNPRYTEQLLEDARQKIMKAKALSSSGSATPPAKEAPGTP